MNSTSDNYPIFATMCALQCLCSSRWTNTGGLLGVGSGSIVGAFRSLNNQFYFKLNVRELQDSTKMRDAIGTLKEVHSHSTKLNTTRLQWVWPALGHLREWARAGNVETYCCLPHDGKDRLQGIFYALTYALTPRSSPLCSLKNTCTILKFRLYTLMNNIRNRLALRQAWIVESLATFSLVDQKKAHDHCDVFPCSGRRAIVGLPLWNSTRPRTSSTSTYCTTHTRERHSGYMDRTVSVGSACWWKWGGC
jgi:hypothetical protein